MTESFFPSSFCGSYVNHVRSIFSLYNSLLQHIIIWIFGFWWTIILSTITGRVLCVTTCSERLLGGVIDLAEQYMHVDNVKVSIVKHCQILYHNNEIWTRESINNFDIVVGSFDEAMRDWKGWQKRDNEGFE